MTYRPIKRKDLLYIIMGYGLTGQTYYGLGREFFLKKVMKTEIITYSLLLDNLLPT